MRSRKQLLEHINFMLDLDTLHPERRITLQRFKQTLLASPTEKDYDEATEYTLSIFRDLATKADHYEHSIENLP